MDFWVVAVTVGAAYIGQHWKTLMRCGIRSLSESSSGSSSFVKWESSPLISQIEEKNCHFMERKEPVEDVSKKGEPVSHNVCTTEVISTSGSNGTGLEMPSNHEDCNVLSLSSSLPEFLSTTDLQGDQGVISCDIVENSGDLLLKPSTREIGSCFGSSRSRSILRSRRTQFVKPLSSLQSCVLAQIYKEHAEMEEYILSFTPSPSPRTVRPFSETDGCRIISRASGEVFNRATEIGENKLHNDTYSDVNDTVLGIPPLPNIESLEILRKAKVRMGKERGERLSRPSTMVNGKHISSQGSSHGALLFCLGISVGIMSSFFANKREVAKLNKLLEQTENLVQDLHEEIEMKDSFTVKEISIENYESQETHDDYKNKGEPHAFLPQRNLDESANYDHKELLDEKAEEESLSKIEAELEAELERLALNMNSTSLERKLSDLVELDLGFVPDIVQGELRIDMLDKQADAQLNGDRDSSGSSTTHSANFVVSPRELSLRLHEVIQSRLEERIKELETELQNSQNKVQYIESDHINSWSPIAKEKRNSAEQAVVINISGEALDGYNESFDELTKFESDDENLLAGIGTNSHQESLQPFDRNLYWVQNDVESHCLPSQSLAKGNASMTFVREKGEDYITLSDDIGSSSNDEMEKLLIKQIVEQTRKGSPAVSNAQRVLFSMSEH